MKYRNLKTGAVINISSELIDRDWERIDVPGPISETEETAPAKKAARGKKK